MNLELAPEDRLLVEAFEMVARDIAGPDFAAGPFTDAWLLLNDGGWTDLSGIIHSGQLDMAAAIAICEIAGGHLIHEQLITGSYVLQALAGEILDRAERDDVRARLAQGGGVILGDGRKGLWGDGSSLHSRIYGLAPVGNAYQVSERPNEQFTLRSWSGGSLEYVVDPFGSPTRADVDLHGGEWTELPLGLTEDRRREICNHALVLHSAALVGLGDALLYRTRDYSLERTQFGQPIGQFQAVKHLVADGYMRLEVARSALLVAAADGATSEVRVLKARLLVSDSLLQIARIAAQIHGGIGFTMEHPLHTYLRAALDGVQRFATATTLAERVGRQYVMETAGC